MQIECLWCLTASQKPSVLQTLRFGCSGVNFEASLHCLLIRSSYDDHYNAALAENPAVMHGSMQMTADHSPT